MRQQIALLIALSSAALFAAGVAYSVTSDTRMTGMMPGMSMPAAGQSSAAPTRQAYTTNHAFLIEVRSVPQLIPLEHHFTLQIAVYDGRRPTKALPKAHLTVTTGMQHGLKHGFAQAMQSTPQVRANGDLFTVSGLYFHVAGPWTLKVEVKRDGQEGTAYFTLPCCGQ